MKRCFTLLTLVALAAVARGDGKPSAWPQFRGPNGSGVADDQKPPVEIGPEKNVKWKVAVPGQGESTPIVWGDRVFLTTAIETDRQEEKPPEQEPEAPGGNPFRIERPGDYGEYRLRLEAPAGMALAEVELLQPVKRQAIP